LRSSSSARPGTGKSTPEQQQSACAVEGKREGKEVKGRGGKELNVTPGEPPSAGERVVGFLSSGSRTT